uniref:Fatty acid desaturase domain-containing protein n=1 Tax=Anopheles dirus TaxID=7168 RepID=A0A182N6I9_9DIPT
MTVGITNTLQFIAGNSAQYMKPGKNDGTGQAKAATVPDSNNNELEDDRTVSNKDLDSYLKHYNRWQQSGWGRTMSALLKRYLGYEFDAEIKWNNVLMIGIFHVIAVWSFLHYVFRATPVTYLWGFFVGGCAGFGVTGGVHRLWCHRSYKAKLPLRIILMCCYSIAGQNTIYDWVRDHRIHHKYSETDGDPHNANRGFLYAHVGWLMLRKHPECIKKGRLIDMSDIVSDPVVQFHHKNFVLMKVLFCFILPTFIPWYIFGETFLMSFFSQCFVRYVLSLNFTWLVNSAAHLYGNHPYDTRINPAENRVVSVVAMGEGWHNYHHVFPWDYKAAELGNYSVNVTTFWLDVFSKIGWAYDLKQPSKELVRKTIEKYVCARVSVTMTVATTTETIVPGTVLAEQDVNVKNASAASASDLNNNFNGMGDSKGISEKDLDDYLHHYNKWEQSRVGRALQQWIANRFGLKFDAEIKWKNVAMIGGLHLTTVVLFFKYVWYSTLTTWLWGIFVGGCAGFGVTGGAHRLWTHRAYKAKLPLRIILMCCYCMSGQNSLFDWVRDHRIHHKYSETDADPHNSNRGFFYAHVGWLLIRKHPECIKKGRLIDMSDVSADPVIKFHERYFMGLKILFTFIVPSFVPWLFLGEPLYLSFLANCLLRYVLTLNFTWLVNSAAHIYGNKPYDSRIRPAENRTVSILSMGEGWHNYHHVFPWDYKAAEMGHYSVNITTFWLDVFSKIGWAYDLKEPSKDLVRRTLEKYGDGTHITEPIGHLQEVPEEESTKSR